MPSRSIAHGAVPGAGDGADNPGVVARPPRIAYLFLGIGAIVGWLWPLPLLPAGAPPALCYAVGAGLVALGLFVMTLAVRAFRAAGTNVETPKPATALVTEGIYARSRNPMYVALVALFGGIAVLADSGWLALLLAAYVAVLRIGVIAREERYLEGKFGEPYRTYRARVRRWL
ncbi:MAG TPA: isoprenylcysteine carboxylmethyltransferase family protein [Methylomirabilota bacterium]|jgi:protein-S-isoprenylcysteine O-methyltransferase Ste14